MKILRFFLIVAGVITITLAFTGFPPKEVAAQATSPTKQPTPTVLQDTTKVALAVQAIGKKKELLKREIARAPLHSMEDVYLLQIKTWQTLEDSHRISLEELDRNEKLQTSVNQLHTENGQTISLLTTVQRQNKDLKQTILTNEQFKREITILEDFLTRSSLIVSALAIIFWLGRIAMTKWIADNRSRIERHLQNN